MILRLSRPPLASFIRSRASRCSPALRPQPCILRNRFVLSISTTSRHYAPREEPEPDAGTETPSPENVREEQMQSTSPFFFEAGYALFAKRPSRPFPPPFLSTPSNSFSDPLSTHDRSRDKRHTESVHGQMIRGVTNGDDAVLVSRRMIAANDGVGAWAQKDHGHAA